MDWHVYRVILRLKTPLHIGRGKISYLQRTRPYVPARTLRGALIRRLALQPRQYATPGDPYNKTGRTISQYMAFTYFFPTVDKDSSKISYLWEDEIAFRRCFLGSYAGTALEYPSQTAAERQLREIECILPHTRDSNEQVYLLGYIFVDEEHIKRKTYDWQTALHHLTVGGERSYGWGRLCLDGEPQPLNEGTELFNKFTYNISGNRPIVCLADREGQENKQHLSRIPAHVPASSTQNLRGSVEPLVGREWRPDNKKRNRRYIGTHIAFKGLYYVPGSWAEPKTRFLIDRDGIWQPLSDVEEDC